MATDESNESQEGPSGQQMVVRKERLPVFSPSAIMDTARFEHLGRVARVMADAGLMPESLTHYGPKEKREPYEYGVVLARAFLIASQADRWEMDPLAVMGCCSLVHNKLMYEGKLVYAVLQARLGINLTFEYGAWDPQKARVMIGVEPPQPELLGVVAHDGQGRSIEGHVGNWKTTGANSPWTSPANWRRQLRYRGSRDWANAYEPALMLGVLTDDDNVDDPSPEPQAQIPAPTLDDAFGKKGAKGGTDLGNDAAGARTAEPDKTTKASATAASTSSAAAKSGQKPSSDSSGTKADADRLKAEAERIKASREAEEKAKPKEEEKPKEGADVVDFPGDRGRKTVDLGVGEKPGTTVKGEVSRETPEGEQPGAGDQAGEPSGDQGPVVEGETITVFNAYAQAVQTATTWLEISAQVEALWGGPHFPKADQGTQEAALLMAYGKAEALNEELFADQKVKPETDPLLYRLWLRQAAKDQVMNVFRPLMRTKAYQGLPEEEQDLILDETNAAAGTA